MQFTVLFQSKVILLGDINEFAYICSLSHCAYTYVYFASHLLCRHICDLYCKNCNCIY